MKPGISVCFVIKNGIKQGYPFWESLKSCLPFADEIVISEGMSDDGTPQFIRRFADMHTGLVKPTFSIFRDDWNSKPSKCGEVISWISNKNIERCQHEWVYYLQADEIVHEGNVDFIKSIANGPGVKYNSIKFNFWHFLGSWNPVKAGAAYHEAIRMVRNRPSIRLVGDAWSFGGAVEPSCPSTAAPHPLFHLGWVFPYNCDQKRVGHAKIYSQHPDYQRMGAEAQERLSSVQYDRGYDLPSDPSAYPKIIGRLYGKVKYELPEEALS